MFPNLPSVLTEAASVAFGPECPPPVVLPETTSSGTMKLVGCALLGATAVAVAPFAYRAFREHIYVPLKLKLVTALTPENLEFERVRAEVEDFTRGVVDYEAITDIVEEQDGERVVQRAVPNPYKGNNSQSHANRNFWIYLAQDARAKFSGVAWSPSSELAVHTYLRYRALELAPSLRLTHFNQRAAALVLSVFMVDDSERAVEQLRELFRISGRLRGTRA